MVVFVLTTITTNLYSQFKIVTSIDPNSCDICKNSYKYFDKISTKIIKEFYTDSDKDVNNYFIKDVLKLPNLITKSNDSIFNELHSKNDNKPICKLYYNNKLLEEFSITLFTHKLDEINELANVTDMQTKLNVLNDTLSKKIFSYLRYNKLNTQLCLFSELNNILYTFDSESGLTHSFNLNTKFILNSIEDLMKLSTNYYINRSYYLTHFEQYIQEQQIIDYMYFENNIYVVLAHMNFDKMIGPEELKKSETFTPFYNYYVIKYSIYNNSLKPLSYLTLSQDTYNKYKISLAISVLDNKPVILKRNDEDTSLYFYYKISENMKLDSFEFSNYKNIHQQIEANRFYNNIVYFNDGSLQFIRMNEKQLNVISYKDSFFFEDFAFINKSYYFIISKYNFLNPLNSTLAVIKFDPLTNTQTLIKSIDSIELKRFRLQTFYKDDNIYIICMRNKKFEYIKINTK